jgi:hypothetical protein
MVYTIFSVDNSRQHYIDRLRTGLSSIKEIQTYCVDGRIPEELEKAQKQHPYAINYDAKVGQLGIWYTVLNALDSAPIITFEDDAMLGADFNQHLRLRFHELPGNTDFFSLFIPRDSDHMHDPKNDVGQYITKAYQRYGGVSMYYTPRGAEKIKALLERDGITGQYDDTLYAYSKSGELEGYCSQPRHPDLVYITGMEKSIVQETESYK